MNLFFLNISISLIILAVLFVRRYTYNYVAVNFYCSLWKVVLLKLLASFVIPFLLLIFRFFLSPKVLANENIGLGIFENFNTAYLYIWLLVSNVLLLLFIGNYCLYLKKMHLARELSKTDIKDNAVMKIEKKVIFKSSDILQSPVTVGVTKSLIIIPEFVKGMTKKEQNYLLYHEICHAKHKDCLWKILAICVAAIYWFNPMIWIMTICLNKDIELRCDYEVISHLGGEKEYAELLLKFARYENEPVYLMNGFGESNIKKRISAILNFDCEKKKFRFSLGMLILFTAMLMFVRMDSLDAIFKSLKVPDAVEGSDISVDDHPLTKYKELDIEFVNGKWKIGEEEIEGLIDVGHCFFVDEMVENGIWVEIIRSNSGEIEDKKIISENQAWKRAEE